MKMYQIGDTSKMLGLSVDTLRYYERIGLIPRITRDGSRRRIYTVTDLSRLRFIQHAQLMNFTLAEIAILLRFRDAPARSRKEVRELGMQKLSEIDERLKSLQVLRRELHSLVQRCTSAKDGCPIIAGLDGSAASRQ